jgi:hypothetical protein
MEDQKKVPILQLTYAAALADATLRMGREGVLDKVTAEKRKEQLLSGKARVDQFGISRPEDVFLKLSDIFDCVRWEIKTEPGGFSAEGKACKLCALAKRMGTQSPCNIYCLDPMEGMVMGLDSGLKFVVKETLWSGQRCRVEVKK